jgi:hypothetical protein
MKNDPSIPAGVQLGPYGRFTSHAHINGATVYLGTFDTVEDALEARLEWLAVARKTVQKRGRKRLTVGV